MNAATTADVRSEVRTPTWARVLEPLAAFLVTRLGLWVLAYIGGVLFPRHSGARTGGTLPDLLVYAWRKWDTGWYVSIVEQGYVFDPTTQVGSVAFFPLYPLLVRLTNLLVGNVTVAGLLVSNVSLALAVVFLYELVAARFGRAVAWRTVLLVCVSPYSFFFSTLYTEALFLLTTVLAFWLAERDRWWLAGLVGLLSALTRQMGVVLLPALGLLYLQRRGWSPRRVGRDALALGLVPLGIGLYMAFLFWRFGDPLAFYRAAVYGWEHASLLETPLERLSPLGFQPESYDLVLALNLGLALLWLAAVIPVGRRLGPAYAALVLLGTAIPLSVGLISLGRYVTVLFPVYVVAAASVQRPLAFDLLVACSALWLSLLTVLFISGYWIV